MTTGECAEKLKNIIEKAMDDLEITSAEYNLVLSTACEDGSSIPDQASVLPCSSKPGPGLTSSW